MTSTDRKVQIERLRARLFDEPLPPVKAIVAQTPMIEPIQRTYTSARTTARIEARVADHADWRDAETYWAAELPADAERTAGYGRWDENDKETRTQ